MKPLHERRRRSAREWFSNCQYAYAGQYVYGVESGNDHTRRGSLFHKARETYIGMLWQSRVRADHEYAEAAWRIAAEAMPLPWPHYQDARGIWQKWTEGYELNLQTFYGVETKLDSILGAPLRMDEVHAPDADTIRIVDAKTYWQIPSPDELRGEFQTAAYLSAARRIFKGFSRFEMVYDFARYGTQTTVSLSDAELDEVDRYIEAQTAAMEQSERETVYPATPGSHCSRCVLVCPLVDEPHCMREVVRADSADDAALMAGSMVAMARSLEQHREALRAWADENGPVSAGDVVFAHHPREKRVYPLVPVADVLKAEGLAELGLTVSATAVAKVAKSTRKYASAAAKLEPLAIVTTETEFSGKRNKTETA